MRKHYEDLYNTLPFIQFVHKNAPPLEPLMLSCALRETSMISGVNIELIKTNTKYLLMVNIKLSMTASQKLLFS